MGGSQSELESTTSEPSRNATFDSQVRRLLDRFCAVSRSEPNWRALNDDLRQSVVENNAEEFLGMYADIFQKDKETGETRIKLPLGLCWKYCSKTGCTDSGCTNLHCCIYFLFGAGNCTSGDRCRFGHDLRTPHNAPLLQRLLVDHLTPSDIGLLITHCGRKSPTIGETPRKSKMPKICTFYNSKRGCRNQSNCSDLHVCAHYVSGNCRYCDKCVYSHDIYNDQAKAILRKCGVDVRRPKDQILEELKRAQTTSAAQIKGASEAVSTKEASAGETGKPDVQQGRRTPQRTANAASLTNQDNRQQKPPQKPPQQQYSEVCLFHLRGMCRYNEACMKYHTDNGVPYQWQFTKAQTAGDVEANKIWQNFSKQANGTIERFYCDPPNDFGYAKDDKDVRIDLCNMKFNQKSNETFGDVRRLGTPSVNSELYASRRFATLWKWYWKMDEGEWKIYEESDEIEQTWKEDRQEFVIPGESRVIHFGELIELNIYNGHEIPVRRRPTLYNSQLKRERKLKATAKCVNDSTASDVSTSATAAVTSDEASVAAPSPIPTSFPPNWTVNNDDEAEFQLVPVPDSGRTAAEFQEIARLFMATLPGETVKSLKRIQNPELWEDFSRHRAKLEKKRIGKGSIETRRLFHGTSQQYVDAICQQGFDWRLSGKSVGTLYGKGSYFARDANYSKCYCSGGTNVMFTVQVIVGDFTTGQSDYVRPPAKDPSLPLHQQDFFDACVNDLNNPSIFVVFQQQQAYPEYLIEF